MSDRFVKYIVNLYQTIPVSLYEGLVFVFFIGLVFTLFTNGFKQGCKKLFSLLLAEYIILLLCSTVFIRSYNERIGHNYTPFWSYVAIQEGRSDLIPVVIMNVIVFMPVGFLLFAALHRFKWWLVLWIGFFISASIETFQFFFHKGFSEVDDVIHNTLGCAIGIMIAAVIKEIWLLPNHNDNANHN